MNMEEKKSLRFEMKKISSILFISCLLFLAACSSFASSSTAEAPKESPTPSIFSTNYNDAMPVASQLALGTLKLKGTADDLTVDEANSLLMLWKGMLAVSSATSPSQYEINGLLAQIQQTMKPSQVQSIAEMKLTNADIAKTTQELGIAFGGGNRSGSAAPANGTTGTSRTGSSSSSSTNRNNNGGGQFFGGPGGGGNFGIPGAGGNATGNNSSSSSANVPQSSQATVQARATQRALAGNTFLYNIVVSYLQSIVPGAAPATATPTPSK
jgi:hypothetical protein